MFLHHAKKTNKNPIRSAKDLTSVVTPKHIMADEKRQQLWNKIQSISSFESPRFEQDCQSLLYQLIEQIQSLPDTFNSFYAQPCGLLDHAIHRTDAALELFSEHVIKEQGEFSIEQKLWLYALLTVGLLQGIGKIQIDYQIELFDTNAHAIKHWNPLLENMTAYGYYHHEFQTESNDDLRRRLNLLLARQLMPDHGFSKIASNAEVLAVWLALLNEDWQSAGILGAILLRADAIAIQRYFDEFLERHKNNRGNKSRITTFMDNNPDALINKDQLLGLEFIAWLKTSLEQGKIQLNAAPLFMVPGGMLMNSEIFQRFVTAHPEYKNWLAVQKGFLSLGVHHLDKQGIVFKQYALALPNQLKIQTADGKINTSSAMALLQQKENAQTVQLNRAGQWVNAELREPAQTKGNPFSGR